MKSLVVAALAALSLALPFSTTAAPDETQKQLIQRAQDAKKKLAAAQAAQGAERQKMMQEHMKMMQDMMGQMMQGHRMMMDMGGGMMGPGMGMGKK